MKDKLFHMIDIIYYHFYRCIMWIVYKYKTIGIDKGADEISPKYEKAIRSFWKSYYRRMDISDYKWYKTKTNQKNIRFIPDIVFHTKIEPHFIDLASINAFSNKCYYSLFFHGFKVPYTVAKNINNIFMDDDFKILSQNEVKQLCLKEDEILIKPAIDSGGGRNITFLQMKAEGADSQLEAALAKYQRNFVIQRVIKQQEELGKMNPSSLNCVRIQSFLYKSKVHILSAFLRVGLPGIRVDNLGQGGIAIAIKDNGEFHPVAYDGEGNIFYRHPNGYEFKGKEMPAFEEIVKSVKELHPRFANFGIIGWDIAVDEEGDPVFIEFNLIDTCIRNSQLANGPFFRELTDDVLKEVFSKKKR